jgi:riboflavin-specific deaminase-like protein
VDVRQILPTRIDGIDPVAAYADDLRPCPAGRPWILVNMIASLDGATALDGKSGGLGGPADKAVFRALRTVPDAILVGAGTARAENYGPVKLDEQSRAMRLGRGQREFPRLVVVSGRLDLDATGPMFTDSIEQPIVFTTEEADPADVAALDAVAEVVRCGTTSVDLRMAMAHLGPMGIRTVLCEGGPTLNGQLVEADLVDEWCQSIAPMLVAGDSARVSLAATGAGAVPPAKLQITRVLEQDSFLFVRAVRDQ